ncbi:MAG: type II secretion system protein N [Rhodoferax sp.]
MTFVLAALAAASAGYWGLKVSAHGSVAAPVASADTGSALDAQAVVRALGGGATPAAGAVAGPARSPFVLMGVLADRSQGGAALISVDGKAAKPYAVGARVDGDWVLRTVVGRKATLAGAGDVRMELELPPVARP